MHETHAGVGDVIVWIVFKVPCQRIDQCAVVVAMAWMNAHAGRLIHHQQVFVFVNNVKRNILGYDLILIAGAVHHHRNLVARMHSVIAFHGCAVHTDALSLGGVLDAVA